MLFIKILSNISEIGCYSIKYNENINVINNYNLIYNLCKRYKNIYIYMNTHICDIFYIKKIKINFFIV